MNSFLTRQMMVNAGFPQILTNLLQSLKIVKILMVQLADWKKWMAV